jgi:hypothetical protein
MRNNGIVMARKAAEGAVEDMPSGPMRIAAFQTILAHLLQGVGTGAQVGRMRGAGNASGKQRSTASISGGPTDRLLNLIDEGVFAQGRSLAEIRQALSEKGWQYKPVDLGTPLTRLVRRGRLKRNRGADGRRGVWMYANP